MREGEGCHVSSSDCIVKLFKSGQTWSNLVKKSKTDQKRGLTANIDIFECLCKFGLHD